MKTPTREQVDAYRRDGFVLVEGFLDAGELEQWRTATADAVAARQSVAEPIGDAYYQRVFASFSGSRTRTRRWQSSSSTNGSARSPVGWPASTESGSGTTRP